VLHEHFPYRDEDMETMAFRVNRIMATRYHEILDFINMHYCLTKRTDSEFWREVQRPERIVPRLKAKLDYWKRKPPSGVDFLDQYFPGMPTESSFASDSSDSRLLVDTGGLWNQQSYECILYGMDFLGDAYRERYGAPRSAPRVAQPVIDRVRAAPSKLPTHDVWLRQVVGMENYGPRDDAWCAA
jgi:tryptophan halogenase